MKNEELFCNIGKRIKELRIKNNLSQKQIADYLKVDQSLLSRIEDGTRTIGLCDIMKLSDLFGCLEDYLLCEINEDTSKPIKSSIKIKDLTVEDLNSIATINKITKNLNEMDKILNM